jgi:hypothetical protein
MISLLSASVSASVSASLLSLSTIAAGRQWQSSFVLSSAPNWTMLSETNETP